MSPEEFSLVLREIRPFTDYIYLHVLGEPLLHPHIGRILQLSAEAGLNVNITTNGSLLQKQKELLLQHPVRQINISLHDAEENIEPEKWKEFILTTLNIATELAKNTYFNFRLWNQTSQSSREFNELCFELMQTKFQLELTADLVNNTGRNITLAPNIWLQLAPRFEWIKNESTPIKNCYGLRDQIAVLSDGSVVPCCIDGDANLLLGNIFTGKLADILQSERAQRIKEGFEQHKAIEPYCHSCGFRAE